MNFSSGRHFLQIPGPTNVPDRILRAMAKPTIDHRGPEFTQKKPSLSLGNGLGRLAGKVFRIGHLGDFNGLMLAGTVSGIEMGLALARGASPRPSIIFQPTRSQPS